MRFVRYSQRVSLSGCLPRLTKRSTYQGTKSDFDDVFIRENIIVVSECTVLTSDISGHLKKKKVLYDKINNDIPAFLAYMDARVPRNLRRRKIQNINHTIFS